MTEIQHTSLSKQAVGAVMMALQKSLLEQSDIVPVLEGFKMVNSPEGLVVLNPPIVKFNEETTQNWDVVAGTSGVVEQEPVPVVDPFSERG